MEVALGQKDIEQPVTLPRPRTPLPARRTLLASALAAQGITEPRRGFRAAPSAGALYPIELYPVVRDVVGLEPGIYHYAVQEHAHRVYSPAKYRERAYRYVLLEAGHVGQNLCLAATGLGLGACTVGAFDDDDLTDTSTLPRNRTS